MARFLRKPWTLEVTLRQEDTAVQALVRRYGDCNWSEVASHLQFEFNVKGRWALDRTGKQCRERWHNHLDPTIAQESWSEADEAKLFELHRVHGNSWSEIASRIPGRTDNSIKNHFYSTIRRNLRKFKKTGDFRGDVKEALGDPEVAEELLRPNYKYVKRPQAPGSPMRRSERSRRTVTYYQSSEEEDAPAAKKRVPEISTDDHISLLCSLKEEKQLTPLICPSPTRGNENTSFEGYSPSALYLCTPTSYLLTPPSARFFTFAEDIKITTEGYVPQPNSFLAARRFDLFSPQNFSLPDFSPKGI